MESLTRMSPQPIAVLGLGAVGSRVAAKLLDAGHDVTVWNRTAGAATPSGWRRHSAPVNGLFAAQLAVAGELLEILRSADADVSSAARLLSSLPVTSASLARSFPRILEGDTAPNFPLELVAKDLAYLIQQADAHPAPVLDAVLRRVRARSATDDIVALATA